MIRSLLAKSVVMSVVMAVVLTVSDASAQPGHDACARDVSRFCRAQINDSEQVVLACLKQNRAKLSKACEKVLTEHGQ
jgi:ATP-dependent Zn protease